MALMPVNEALEKVVAGVKPKAAEMIDLTKAHGRVLAKDVAARRDQPPFPASAMDGYAIRHADIQHVPAVLRIIGVSAAGHGFRGTVKAGEAVRIFTGAPVPKGADTVVIQENAESDGAAVVINAEARPAQHIRRQGLDFSRGDILLKQGRTLNARDLGLAAAMNCATLPVRQMPRVALLTTGDELVRPGGRLRTDQIVSSNGAALSAFVRHFGGSAHDLGIVRDRLGDTMRGVARAAAFDILVTTGGASVGDHDFVHEALSQSGVMLGFWKIALRPGKPLMFGRKGKLRVLGLPGNPVSALVCARLFLKPLLDAYLGRAPEEPMVRARLATAMTDNDNRQDYVRARITSGVDGVLVATPFSIQDSSMQRTLGEAAGLIVRAPHAPAAESGEMVDLLPIDF